MSRTVALERRTSPDRAESVRVMVIAGPDLGLDAVSVSLPCVIGRSVTADFRLSDPTASAMHVEITGEPDGLGLRDLGSSNGTACGGVRIGLARVASGAHVEIGTTTVRLDVDGVTAVRPEIESFGALRSASPAMRGLFALLERVAPTDLTIVIESASLAEADLVARSIHDASGRDGPYSVVDCAMLGPALADTILFGGVLEAGGTLYLRSLSDLAPELQRRMLDAQANVRLISSTTRELAEQLNRGAFHEDLFDRLAQVRARVPPLGARAEDIPAHVYAFLQAVPAAVPAARAISKEALGQLRRREWPGGLRELREVVERAARVASSAIIGPDDLAFERVLERARGVDVDIPFKEAKRSTVDAFERGYLEALLERCGNNMSRAAILSGVERHHLRDLFRKHGLRGKEGE
jgi:DNA-binding NtrC family response regulator